MTRVAFQICLLVVILGLLAQLVMAAVAFPALPQHIPASWIGSTTPYKLLPAWIVFLAFPGAQIVLLLLAIFSPRDVQGRRAMETGKAVSLILLAVLFTVLQSSVFHIRR